MRAPLAARLAGRATRPGGRTAVGLMMAAYGPDHPDVAIRLSNLAAILEALGLAGEGR